MYCPIFLTSISCVWPPETNNAKKGNDGFLVSSNGANQTAQIIKDKFNKTGVKAGIAKFL